MSTNTAADGRDKLALVDPLEITVLSALGFISSYSHDGLPYKERGLEYLVHFDGMLSIDDCVANDEVFYHEQIPKKYPSLKNFRQGQIPHSVRGLLELRKANLVLPMTYLSEHFANMNALAMVVQFGGEMDRKYSAVYHNPSLALPRQERLRELITFFQQKPGEPDNYHLTSFLVGRTLAQLGVVSPRQVTPDLISGKKKYGIRMLPHILYLSKVYAMDTTQHKEEIRNLLLDAVAALYLTSFGNQKKTRNEFTLPGQLSEKSASKLGSEIVFVLQSLFTGEIFYSDPKERTTYHRDQTEGTLYVPRVSWSPETGQRMLRELEVAA